ncbi:uncharacterized protein LOC127709456 isoform X3 [Mytilus californianus]|uniref:uncharacterized protein LOC127709456 isoform X3 n=1 Tax=Mytilus californianus TaxID=6549 RepID=UPI002246F61F|nr:uncharacterized protein LOC127709456 isoform X3 [Mytilus californianus]
MEDIVVKTETLIDENEKVTSNINNDVLNDNRLSQSNILSNNLSGRAGNLTTNMCDIVVKKEPIFDGNEKVEVNTDFDSQFEILGSVITFKDEKEDTIEVPQPLNNENISQSNLSSGKKTPSVEKGAMVVPPVQTELMYEKVMCPSNFSSGQNLTSVEKREMVVPPVQSKLIFEKMRKLLSTRALSVKDVSLPSNISENTLNSNAINSQPIDSGQDFVKSHSIEVTGTVSNKSLSTSDQSVLPHTSKPRPHIIKRFVRIKPISIGKSDSSVNNEEKDKIDHNYSYQHGQSDIVISSVTAAPHNLQAVNLGDCNRSSDGFTCEKNKNERTKEIQEINYSHDTVNMVNSLQTKCIGKWGKKKEPRKCEVLGRKEVLSRSEKLRYTFRPITIMLPSNAKKTGYDCKECNKTIVFYNYQRLPMYQCKECPFSSICKNTFMSHYNYSIFHHKPLNVEKKPGFPSIKEKKLEFTLGCRCRLFLTNSPIEMADHLASCEVGNKTCLIIRDMNSVASFFNFSLSEFTKELNSMTPKELTVQRNITTDFQDVQTQERFDPHCKDQYSLNVAKRLERQISSKFSGVPISVSISPAAIGGKTRNFMNNHNTSKRIQNSELPSIWSVQDDSEFQYVEKVSQVSETDSFMNHFPKVRSVATDTKTNTSLGFSTVTPQIAQKAAQKTFQTIAPKFTLISSGVGQTSISPTYLKTAGNIALPLINKNQNKTANVTLSSSNTAPRAVVLLLPGKAGQKDVLFFPTVTTPTTTNDVSPVLTAPPKSGQNTTTSTIQNTASGSSLTFTYDVKAQKIIQWEPDKSEQTVLMLKKSNFTPHPSLRTSSAVTKLSSIVSTMGPSTKLVNLAPIVSKKYPPRLQNSGPSVYTVYPPTRPHDSASVISTACLSAETQSSTQYDGQNSIQTDIPYSAQTDTWNLTPRVSTSSRVSVMIPLSEAQNLINTISWDTVPILTPVSEELVQDTASTSSESLASRWSEIIASRRSENTAVTRSESIASTRSESTAITRSENTASARFESTASTRTESTVITWSESTASTRTESTASTRSESITSTRSESTESACSESIASTRSESIASTRSESTASICKPFPLALFPNVAALQNKGNGLQPVESTHNNVSQLGVSQVSSSMNQMSTLKRILQSLHYRVPPSNSASNFAQNPVTVAKNSPFSIATVPSNTGESVSQGQKERTSKAKQQITGKNAAEVNRLDAFAAGDDGNNKKLKRKFTMQGFKLNEILCTRNKRRKEALEKCLKISREVLNDNSFSGSIHCTSNQLEADNTSVCAQDKMQTVLSAKDQMQTVVLAKDQMQTVVAAADRTLTVVSSNNQIQTLTPAKDQMRTEVSAIDQMQAVLAAHLISKGDYCAKTLTNMKEKELSRSHNTEVKVEPLDKEYFQTEICQPEVVIENVEGTDYCQLYNDNKGKSIPHTKSCSSSEEHLLVERRIKEEYVPMENSSVVFENIPRESIESEPLNINSGLFYSSETESCPSDNGFYPSDDDICQSVKAICPSVKDICPSVKDICPSVKDICPSVKDICPSVTITTADSSLSVRNFPFGRDCKEVGKSRTEVVKVSAERRMSWIKNQSLQRKDFEGVYKMQVPCSGETNAQLSDNRQQQSTQDMYVCKVKQEPLEETEKDGQQEPEKDGQQEPEPLNNTVSTADSGHNENTFLEESEQNTQQLDNGVQVKQEIPMDTDEYGQQMPEPLNMNLSQVVQVKEKPSMETDKPVQQMPEPLNTNLSPVVQVKEKPSMETDKPVQQMPEPLNTNLSPGAASVSTPGLTQLVITPVYELKDGKIQIKLCLKPLEKDVNLKENQQNNFVSVPLVPVSTTDKEGTESSSNKQGLQKNSEKNYQDKKLQHGRRLPNILSSNTKVQKKEKGKGSKYNQYAKWCELTRKKSQNEDPEIEMESVCDAVNENETDDLDTSLIDSNIVHIGEIQHRKENRSLINSDVDSEELQTMVEDTSLIASDVVDSEEIHHRKEDTSLIDSDVVDSEELQHRREDISLNISDVFDRREDTLHINSDIDMDVIKHKREDKMLTDSDVDSEEIQHRRVKDRSLKVSDVVVREEDSSLVDSDVFDRGKDRSLLDADVVDRKEVQPGREDKSLTDSNNFYAEEVQNKTEDRSLMDSDIVDSEDVQLRAEDKSLIDSDIVDSEEVQHKRVDRSLIDSDIIDSEKVRHKREDRSLIDSDIIGTEEVQHKREDRSLIDSDIIDTEEVQHKREDTSLMDSDIVDSEEVQHKRADRSLMDSDIVDSEEVQHKREDTSLMDSDIVDSEEVQHKREDKSLIDSDIVDIEEIQPTFCRKEDTKEDNLSCNDNTIATSNNELTGTEDSKIASKEGPNQAEVVEKTILLKRSRRCRNKSWKITENEKSKIEGNEKLTPLKDSERTLKKSTLKGSMNEEILTLKGSMKFSKMNAKITESAYKKIHGKKWEKEDPAEQIMRLLIFQAMVNKHTGRLACRFCTKEFWYEKYLEQHLKLSHLEERTSVQKITEREFVKYLHEITEDLSKVFRELARALEDKNMLAATQSRNLKNTNIKVILCNIKCTDLELLMYVYTIDDWFCQACNKKFSSKNLIDELQHHACGKKFSILYIRPSKVTRAFLSRSLFSVIKDWSERELCHFKSTPSGTMTDDDSTDCLGEEKSVEGMVKKFRKEFSSKYKDEIQYIKKIKEVSCPNCKAKINLDDFKSHSCLPQATVLCYCNICKIGLGSHLQLKAHNFFMHKNVLHHISFQQIPPIAAINAESQGHEEPPTAVSNAESQGHEEQPTAVSYAESQCHEELPTAVSNAESQCHEEPATTVSNAGSQGHEEPPTAVSNVESQGHEEQLTAVSNTGSQGHKEPPLAVINAESQGHEEPPRAATNTKSQGHDEPPTAVSNTESQGHKEPPTAAINTESQGHGKLNTWENQNTETELLQGSEQHKEKDDLVQHVKNWEISGLNLRIIESILRIIVFYTDIDIALHLEQLETLEKKANFEVETKGTRNSFRIKQKRTQKFNAKHLQKICSVHLPKKGGEISNAVQKKGEHTVVALPVQKEGKHTVDALPLPKEGEHTVDALPLQKEGEQTVDALPLQKEREHTVDALPLQKEREHTVDALPLQKEGEQTADALPLQKEREHTVDALSLQKEREHTVDALPLQKKRKHTVDTVHKQKKGKHNVNAVHKQKKKEPTIYDEDFLAYYNTCNMYMCKFCDKGFSHYVKMKDHIFEEHPDEKNRCKICQQMFRSTDQLRKHVRNTQHYLRYKKSPSEEKEAQKICSVHLPKKGEEISNAVHLQKEGEHTVEDEQYNNMYKCKYCNKGFSRFVKMINHVSKDHPDEKKRCKICHKMFGSIDKLRRHVKKTKHYIRKVVEKTKNNLRQKKSQEEKEHMCEYCGETFYSWSILNYHIKNYHLGDKDKKPRHECVLCGKVFVSVAEFASHRKNDHSRECKICLKVFCSVRHLERHHKLKHSQKHFKCPKCWRTYAFNYLLQMHIKFIHEDYKPYSCDICDYKCYMKNAIVSHMKNNH